MRKVLIGSAVILAVFFPVTASAAVADQPKPAPTAWSSERDSDDDFEHDDEDKNEDENEALEHRMHQELESRYGKHGSFQIPPLVLRPGPNAEQEPTALGAVSSEPVLLNATIITPSSINGVVAEGITVQIGSAASGTQATGQGGAVGAQGIGPNAMAQTVVAAKPVDFALVQLNQQTPAQQFFNVATIALAALAAAAVAIGATVGVRALREWRTERA